jgi:hypothetical protein
MTPAGIDIIIARENPKAIITNKALIFRLEIFLTARVTTTNLFTFQDVPKKRTTKKGALERVVGAIAAEVSKLVTFILVIFVNSLFGRHFLQKC